MHARTLNVRGRRVYRRWHGNRPREEPLRCAGPGPEARCLLAPCPRRLHETVTKRSVARCWRMGPTPRSRASAGRQALHRQCRQSRNVTPTLSRMPRKSARSRLANSRIQHFRQLACVLASVLQRSRSADRRSDPRGPCRTGSRAASPLFVPHRHDEPAAVAGLIMVRRERSALLPTWDDARRSRRTAGFLRRKHWPTDRSAAVTNGRCRPCRSLSRRSCRLLIAACIFVALG